RTVRRATRHHRYGRSQCARRFRDQPACRDGERRGIGRAVAHHVSWRMSEQKDELIIRQARATDAIAIARVRVAAWRAAYRGLIPDSYLDRPDFEQLEALNLGAALRDIADEARISVVELGGQVVGFCAYGSVEDDDGKLTQGGIYRPCGSHTYAYR